MAFYTIAQTWNQIESDSSFGTLISCLRQIDKSNEDLQSIEVLNAWRHLKEASNQLYNLQVTAETRLADLAVEIKDKNDNLALVTKEISTLSSFLTVTSNEGREITGQERDVQTLAKQYSSDLQKSKDQLERKIGQNVRVLKGVTSALAKAEIEARKALKQMEHFKSDNMSRKDNLTQKRQINEESIVTTRIKLACLKSQQSELMNEIRELMDCFRSKMKQVEKLMTLSVALGPIAMHCQVLCQMCQDVSPDPWIIQLGLGKLGSSLHVCFGQEVDTDDLEIKSLQTLASSLHSVNQLTVHSLGPVEDRFFENDDEFLAIDGLADSIPALEAPQPRKIKGIEKSITSLKTLSSTEETDFSLNDLPPQGGFRYLSRPISFQACIIQVETSWWAFLVAKRHAFDMFQFYTRVIARCLLQVFQSIQMDEELSEKMLGEPIPVLDNTRHKMNTVADKSGSNFDTLNGLLSEMTESCTTTKSQANTCQEKATIKQAVNKNESKENEAKIRNMIEERKKFVNDIVNAQEEFAKMVLGLPGVLSVLTSTAGGRVMSVVRGVTGFFKKVTEKARNFKIFETIGAFRDGVADAAEAVVDYFTEDLVDDSDQPISFKDKRTALEEEVEMEQKIYSRIFPFNKTAQLLIVMLSQKDNFDEKSMRAKLWEMQDTLDVTARAMKKTAEVEESTQLKSIVSCVLNVCQDVLHEAGSGRLTDETRRNSIEKLNESQKSLNSMLNTRNRKLIAKFQKAVESMKRTLMKQGFMSRLLITSDFGKNKQKLETALKKMERKIKIQQILSSLMNSCDTLLQESKSMTPSAKTREKAVRDIRSVQYSLENILQEMEGSITSKSEQLQKLQAESSDQTQYKGYEAPQKRELQRLAKGQDLYFYWKRYDRQTENITSHFDAQKETAQVLAKLTLELSELRKNLELMSKTSTDLSNLQTELELVNNFTRDVCNVVQVKLSSNVDAVVKTLKKSVERLKLGQQTKMSALQKEMMQTQIMETVLIAKGVHDCSRNFLDTIEYFLFKFLNNGSS